MSHEHEPERPKLDLAKDFSRGNDLFTFEFSEKSMRHHTAQTIENAFVVGFTCFLFKFTFKNRHFEWRVALPPAAGFDELDAYETGLQAFARFLNTVAKLVEQEKRGIVETIINDDD